jgi:hypothetical protein
VRTPCVVECTNVDTYSIEEDPATNPPGVRIYFEGAVAWYEIRSAHASYAPIYEDMKLKSSIWLWIQEQRSIHCRNSSTQPSLALLRRELPERFTTRVPDPLDAFHAYFIERLIQMHNTGEMLTVGPAGIYPQWMDCLLHPNLRNAYPVHPL